MTVKRFHACRTNTHDDETFSAAPPARPETFPRRGYWRVERENVSPSWAFANVSPSWAFENVSPSWAFAPITVEHLCGMGVAFVSGIKMWQNVLSVWVFAKMFCRGGFFTETHHGRTSMFDRCPARVSGKKRSTVMGNNPDVLP